MLCRFLKSNEVVFSSSLHPRNAHTPEQELLFWKNGQFYCQDYSYRNIISVLGKTIPFPHLQFYLVPGRKLFIFLSVHCKKAHKSPKAHPLLESSDLSSLAFFKAGKIIYGASRAARVQLGMLEYKCSSYSQAAATQPSRQCSSIRVGFMKGSCLSTQQETCP